MSFSTTEGNRFKDAHDFSVNMVTGFATPFARVVNASLSPDTDVSKLFGLESSWYSRTYPRPPCDRVEFPIQLPIFWLYSLLVGYGLYCPVLLSAFIAAEFTWSFVRCIYSRFYPFEPQAGVSKAEVFVREVTLLSAALVSIRESRSKAGVVAAVTSYIQAHSRRSIFSVLDYMFAFSTQIDVTELLDTFQAQSGLEEIQWIESIRNGMSDWKSMKRRKNVANLIQVLNLVVATGMCSASSLTFSLGSFEIFAPTVLKRQMAADDFGCLVCETILGFIEGGYLAFKTGKVDLFLGKADDFTEFEKQYAKVQSLHGYALAGNLKDKAQIADNTYDDMLNSAITLGARMLSSKIFSKDAMEYRFLSDRVDRLRNFHAEFSQTRCRGGLRAAPFALSFFGNTGVGKSSVNQVTIEAILKYNGREYDQSRIATWADNDKFASQIRSSTDAIIFDDFGNTKSEFQETSPCYRLLQVINNANFLAPMADVFLKGKVAFLPSVVTVTTNVESLNAGQYSNKPESILRRLYHVKVDLKEEFATAGILDPAKVEAKFGPLCKYPDIWNLSVRRCVVGGPINPTSMQNHWTLKPILFRFEGSEEIVPMENVSLQVFLKWAQEASKVHFSFQDTLVSRSRQEDDPLCKECGFLGCNCPKKIEADPPGIPAEIPFEEQSGIFATLSMRCLFSFIMTYYFFGWYVGIAPNTRVMHWISISRGYYLRQFVDQLRDWMQRVRSSFSNTPTGALISLQEFYSSSFFWWTFIVPESFVDNPLVIMIVMFIRMPFFCLHRARMFFLYLLVTGCLPVGIIAYVPTVYWKFAFILHVFLCGILAALYRIEYGLVRSVLLDRQNVVRTRLNFLKRHYGKIVLGSVVALVGLYTLLKKFDFSPQGNLVPRTMEDVAERNAEANPWGDVQTAPLPMTIPSKTSTGTDLAKSISDNIVVINALSDNRRTRGFFVDSNFMLVPTHFVDAYDSDFRVRCNRRDPKFQGPNFSDMIAKEYTYNIPGTDFSLVWVANGGAWKNVTRFFVEGSYNSKFSALFVLKRDDCSVDLLDTQVGPVRDVKHSLAAFKGSHYVLPENTAVGFCMSPIVSNGRGSCILGFHLGGNGRNGISGIVTREQITSAVFALSKKPGVVRSCSMGNMPQTSFGVPLIQEGNVHRKSAVRHLPEGSTIEVFGPTSGMATPHSSVVPTLISPHVEEVCGVPQQWGPPKTKGEGVYPYQATLVHLANPSMSLGSVLTKAVESYRLQFQAIHDRIPEVFNCSPLGDVETISGIAGEKYIDAMRSKTSPGWPLNGRKDKLMIDLDPKDYPHIGRPRTFTKEVWDEIDVLQKTLLQGERPYCVWKGCLKDEPTKITKDKVRVFQSAPLPLQFLIRKYFLPIVKIMQLNPIDTECAVGVNAEGPEWEQLSDYIDSKGPNILAGDYSKYDLRMPAQLVIASLSVLIWVAETFCQYTAEDIAIMRALVHEISYPIMAYNGDLIQIFGSNPSGQNLTVIVNGIVGLLLLRCFFFTLYPLAKLDEFRKAVAAMTYGDDLKSSVSPDYPEFNHISFAAFLAQYDIVFTMPDKESTPTPYMRTEDADFLKRTTRYEPALDAKIGVLAESSIFKRLHSHLLSGELSLTEQSAQNIDTSLHDWFYHGRDVYETRLAQMQAVAEKAGITHLCSGFIPFDTRVLKWREKYLGEVPEVPLEEELEYTAGGGV